MAVDEREKENTVKCVVWDLDETLWHGTLLENDEVRLRDGVVEIIETLDRRGILHSIASRNDAEAALGRLRVFGLEEYFLTPRIGWSAKSEYIRQIVEELNIGVDTLLFIDDQPFEREEVGAAHPTIRTADVSELAGILERPDLNPRFVTDESLKRRQLYRSDVARRRADATFTGPTESFLASLEMSLTLERAVEDDLARAEELTRRTNQLNATGYTYSYDELAEFLRSPRHKLLIAKLADRFGSHGKIGLSLIECAESDWTIKLLLTSCRVMSRGIGSVVLREIVERAQAEKVNLWADFVPTDRNRLMYVTYRFAGFDEEDQSGSVMRLKHGGGVPPPRPDYVRVRADF